MATIKILERTKNTLAEYKKLKNLELVDKSHICSICGHEYTKMFTIRGIVIEVCVVQRKIFIPPILHKKDTGYTIIIKPGGRDKWELILLPPEKPAEEKKKMKRTAKPKCKVKKCRKRATEGSEYCYEHRHTEVEVTEDGRMKGQLVGMGL